MTRTASPNRGTDGRSTGAGAAAKPRPRPALSPAAVKVILALGDIAGGAVALGGALTLSLQMKRWSPALGTSAFGFEIGVCGVLAAVWLALALINGAYDTTGAYRLSHITRALTRTTVEAGALYLLAYFVLSRPILALGAYPALESAEAIMLPRVGPALILIMVPTINFVWRCGAAKALTSTMFRQRTLIVGATPGNLAFLSQARDIAIHHDFVGLVCTPTEVGHSDLAMEMRVLGEVNQLPALVDRFDVDLLICCASNLDTATNRALLRCREQGAVIRTRQAVYEELFSRLPITTADDASWYSAAAWTTSKKSLFFRGMKRAVDIACGLLGLAFTLVLLIPIAVAIRSDSPGPIWHTQRRAGRGGKEFTIIKFRTMVQDAERQGIQWAADDDPRATRVGRFLRRSRLDELPQFINVLRGDMSIVGPRPERPEITRELERQLPAYRARLLVRPGLTGWAQVNYRYGNTFEDAQVKLELDLYYVKYESLPLDILIMLRTWGTITSFSGT